MDRKAFYSTFFTVVGLCLLLGGYLAWQSYSRAQLQQALLEQAQPLLDQMKEKELKVLSKPARDQIRVEFAGICAKVPDFYDEISSAEFARQLAACPTQDEKRRLFLLTFKRTVTTDAEILGKVRELTDKATLALDQDWAGCCEELTERWNLAVKPYGVTLTGAQLAERMQPTITAGLRRAAEPAQGPAHKGRLGASLQEIADKALVMPPVEEQGIYKGMPAFSAKSFSSIFDSMISQVQKRPRDLRKQISSRLADLGNLLAYDYCEEIRSQINELHEAQQKAVEDAAAQQACELIHIL